MGITLNAGSGGATLATDLVGGTTDYQVAKLAHGTAGAATLVSTASGLPVQQQGTWTVQPGNTANTTAWKVDGSAVTQPVSAASLPLPSGASTSAKQPALGTAGTASTDVLTVQGIASMTALKIDGSAVTQPVSASALPLPSGAATAAKQPALGTAGTASTDVISIQGIASMTAVKVDGSAVTQPVSGTVTASNTAGDVASGSADSGNPVKVGGKAATALPTAVSANQRANLLVDVYGRPWVRGGHQGPAGAIWSQHHVPAANAQATATKTAAGAGVRNVCTGLTVVLAATGTAPTAAQISVSLIDGASAATTYLWRAVISVPATAGATSGFVLSDVWLPGTANTAMTLEFSAAGGANTIESVSMHGTTVAE